jgi:hypothetical protein
MFNLRDFEERLKRLEGFQATIVDESTIGGKDLIILEVDQEVDAKISGSHQKKSIEFNTADKKLFDAIGKVDQSSIVDEVSDDNFSDINDRKQEDTFKLTNAKYLKKLKKEELNDH